MFDGAVLLAVVVLAFSAIAKSQGVAIPIHKRSAFTLPNGVFNHDKAVLATLRTKYKHRRNLINLQRNLRLDALPAGATILPLAVLHREADELLQKRHHSEPLIDEDSESMWAGLIKIGTPGQPFLIDFDTGSSDLWVPSASCTGPICAGKNRYNSTASCTAKPQPGSFTIRYADNSTVSGPVASDTVNVADVVAKNQFFSPVTALSSFFGRHPIDGFLGMAFPALSSLGHNPFFNTAISQCAVRRPLFSFKLATDGPELFLGGYNHCLFTGLVEWHSLTINKALWEISNARVCVNGNRAISGISTILDTGTAFIYGQTASVKQVYAQIPGSSLYSSTQGTYSFPCNSNFSVSFNWGGHDWEMSADTFNLGLTALGSDRCVGAILETELGLGHNVWLLGDAFMQNVYTVFDFGANRTGFATLA